MNIPNKEKAEKEKMARAQERVSQQMARTKAVEEEEKIQGRPNGRRSE